MASVAENLFKNVKDVKHTIRVETVTPQKAAKWLELNTKNRFFKNQIMLNYAKAMIEGKWKPTFAPILFGSNGVLLDGQHRLSAVCFSGVDVEMLVITGVDPDAFDAIDTGSVRRGSDVLSIEGLPGPVARAASKGIGLAMNYESPSRNMDRRWAYDNGTILAYSKNNPGIIEAAEFIVNKLPRISKPLADGVGCFLRYETCKKDRRLSDDFFDKLYTGADLKKGDMILFLREIINHDRMFKRMTTPISVNHLASCVMVWNRIRKGTKVSHKRNIRHPFGAPFPIIK